MDSAQPDGLIFFRGHMATVSTISGSNPGKQWVVVKFGGTSVSYGDTWQQIVTRVKELQNGPDGSSYNVLLVLSALTQVRKTND